MRPITCPNCLHEIRRPHGRPKIPKEIRTSIKAMRKQGMSLRRIAEVHEVACSSVYYIVNEKEKAIERI